MTGASAALTISEIPFLGPLGAVRVALIEGAYVVNPLLSQLDEATLDLVVSASRDAIVMVEAGANEATEEQVLEGLRIAHREIQKLIDAQLRLAELAGKPKWEVPVYEIDRGLYDELVRSFGAEVQRVTAVEEKKARQEATVELREQIVERLTEGLDELALRDRTIQVKRAFAQLEKDVIRRRIAVEKRRPDGRAADEIRPITCEVGLMPRTHGSALFTRGQTQALTLLTLGATGDAQRIDTINPEQSKKYLHHYNFPPYSVGETGFMRGPKRRDIGHGALAERALLPMLPDEKGFPYTIRLVSEILESNGSSSMASVCGSTLSLMDAGVQIREPVAGIAMGLIKEGDDYVVLSDIAGVEDHLGDMDFKVAGSAQRHHRAADGHQDLRRQLRDPGRRPRAGPARPSVHPRQDAGHAARAARRPVAVRAAHLHDPDQPRPDRPHHRQGRRDDQGTLTRSSASRSTSKTTARSIVAAPDMEAGEAVTERITSMTKDIEVGDIITGKVVKTTDFGAFVELKKGVDGLIHISKLGGGKRVDKVEDVVSRGDTITVEVVEIDKARNRIGLKPLDAPADR